jgi:hypothetical protein
MLPGRLRSQHYDTSEDLLGRSHTSFGSSFNVLTFLYPFEANSRLYLQHGIGLPRSETQT